MTLARLAPVLFVLLWSTGWVVAKYAGLFADPLTFLSLRYGVADPAAMRADYLAAYAELSAK